MRIVTCLIFLLAITACNKGIWVTENVYRPKRPRFSIQKKTFMKNEMINNDFLYISTRKINSHDKVHNLSGFFDDGRMIGNQYTDINLQTEIHNSNSWESAYCIGYYTTEGNTITMEYFLSGDGGRYEKKKGIIKQDTIILIEKIQHILHRETRYDTLVKS